eukprot:6197242-Pleurochrysis_carterae.AAC.1
MLVAEEAESVSTGGWWVSQDTGEAAQCLTPTPCSLQSTEEHAGTWQLQTCATSWSFVDLSDQH